MGTYVITGIRRSTLGDRNSLIFANGFTNYEGVAIASDGEVNVQGTNAACYKGIMIGPLKLNWNEETQAYVDGNGRSWQFREFHTHAVPPRAHPFPMPPLEFCVMQDGKVLDQGFVAVTTKFVPGDYRDN